MATILITGGTGMIGTALAKALIEKNHHVIIVSRRPNVGVPETGNLKTATIRYAEWNVRDQSINKDAIEKADYIIHLAGAAVANKRWTAKRKKEIVDSRVKGAELIVKSLEENPNRVKAIISASGIGWYGPDPLIPNPNPFTEKDDAAIDFLGETCKSWEGSLDAIQSMGKRLVIFRTGIVLSDTGGAIKEFLRPLRYGIATILGSGRQVVSWIHIDDLVAMYVRAIESDEYSGVFNAVSPRPVTNRELVLQLAKKKRGRLFIPIYVPSFLLKFVLGEMSVEVLKSATVSCKKIVDTGFTFLHPSIQAAIQSLKI